MWWGIGIVACSAPMGWVGLIGPAFMNFSLVFLTGKANNESKMNARPAYRYGAHFRFLSAATERMSLGSEEKNGSLTTIRQ